jgi:hypothetical protein
MAKRLLALVAGAALFSGCAMAASPVNGWYADVKWGTEIPSGSPGSKVGMAECQTILGLFASGDATVETAARNGGITTVKTVDHHSMNVLGIYSKFTTKVTGD